MTIEVTNYFPINEAKSSVVGIVNFFIPEWGFHIHGCSYVRKKNGGFFIGYPSKEVKKPNEETKWFPHCRFVGEKHERFQKAAKIAITEWIVKNGEMD